MDLWFFGAEQLFRTVMKHTATLHPFLPRAGTPSPPQQILQTSSLAINADAFSGCRLGAGPGATPATLDAYASPAGAVHIAEFLLSVAGNAGAAGKDALDLIKEVRRIFRGMYSSVVPLSPCDHGGVGQAEGSDFWIVWQNGELTRPCKASKQLLLLAVPVWLM